MKRKVVFSPRAWNEYVEWQTYDKVTAKKILELINDIDHNGLYKGIGKPERLKYMNGLWSRRINIEDRLLYNLDQDGNIYIFSCKGHYDY